MAAYSVVNAINTSETSYLQVKVVTWQNEAKIINLFNKPPPPRGRRLHPDPDCQVPGELAVRFNKVPKAHARLGRGSCRGRRGLGRDGVRGPRLHIAPGASDRENRYRSPWPRRKLTGQEKRNPAARLRTVDRQAAPHHYDRPCQRSRGEWFGCGHITERRRSAGLRIERRKLAKRAAGRRAGERGRPPRTRVRGGDAGERNLRLNAKIEFADIVAIVPILRRSSAEHLLRFSTGWKPGQSSLTLRSRRATTTSGGSS